MNEIVDGMIDGDGNLHIPVAIDLGPAVQQELASGGLAGQPAAQAEGPSDNLPPPGEASQAELAETLAAAERLTPPRVEYGDAQEEADPDEPGEFFVGYFNPDTPVYGCPGCAIRGEKPEDIMWHLRSYPSHQRR